MVPSSPGAAEEVGWRPLLHHAALVEQDGRATKRVENVWFVLGNDRRPARQYRIRQHADHARGLLRTETAGRLVHKQQTWGSGERSRKLQAALLRKGKLRSQHIA